MKRLGKEARIRHKRRLLKFANQEISPSSGFRPPVNLYEIACPPGYKILNAPLNISIEGAEVQRSFLTFFELLNDTVKVGRVFISFQKTCSASAAGLVLFVANIDLLIGTYGQGRLACSSLAENKFVNRVLRVSGIITLIRTGDYVKLDGGVIPVVKGNTGSQIHDLIDAILKTYFNDKIEALSEQKISTALTEAVLNVQYHAYEGVPEPKIGQSKPWWFLTEVSNQTLSLALYDFGIGIPASLPRKDFFEKLAAIFSVNDDADMIEASLETSRTRTNLDQHGKGGRDIKALVETSAGAHLVIYSNAGVYQISRNGESNISKEKFSMKKPLRGTLIQWQIPLESFKNEDH